MRVIFLGHTAVLSGGELAFATLVPALADRGVEALVVLAEDGPLVGRLESAGVSVEVESLAESARTVRREQLDRFPGRAAVDIAAYTRRLSSVIRRWDADIVHTFSLKAALYGGAAGRLARRPVIWSIQDRIADDYLPSAAVHAVRAAARVFPRAIIANSKTTAATLLGVGPAPVVIWPACAIGDPVPPPASDAPFTAGLIGRLSPWKGQDVFLSAFAEAFGDDDGPDAARARLIGSALFGEQEHEATLRAQVDSLGLAGRVDFRGFCDDVPAELAALDVVVHASTVPEPFGMVIVEAMAAGRPVIAAGSGGPAEVVTDGVDGMLVRPGDVGALASALGTLRGDDDLRARLAAAGPATAVKYGPGPAAESTCGVYESLLER